MCNATTMTTVNEQLCDSSCMFVLSPRCVFRKILLRQTAKTFFTRVCTQKPLEPYQSLAPKQQKAKTSRIRKHCLRHPVFEPDIHQRKQQWRGWDSVAVNM